MGKKGTSSLVPSIEVARVASQIIATISPLVGHPYVGVLYPGIHPKNCLGICGDLPRYTP